MRFIRPRGATLALLAVLFTGSLLLGVATTQRILPGHLTAVQTVQQLLVPEPQHVFGKANLRVLVVGLDYDYSDKDEETSAHSRSDIIMAVNLDFSGRRIYELSVPRDMVATMPDGRQAKINQAQSDGGIHESEAVVSQWLGTPPFDRYVVLRIDTMKDLIDALGGVTVDVENSDALRHAGSNGPIDYDDSWGHLHVHLRPGLQHLNGREAVGYARFRHDWCSDPCRIMRQQQVIHAIAQQVQQNQFNTLMHVRPLLAVLQKDVESNLSPDEQLSLAFAFGRVDSKDIVTAQVPYVASIDLPNYGDSIVPDEAQKRALVASMLSDPPPPEPDVQILGAIRPADVVVQVKNGTTVPGLARQIAHKLSGAGFVVSSVGDADESDIQQSTISAPSASVPLAFKVRQALGTVAKGARVVYATGDAATPSNGVVVVLGADAGRTFAKP